MSFCVAQISDTHLGREKPFFVANFLRISQHLMTVRPDLVVNTGDMSLDGSACEADLAESRRLHDALDLPIRFIPGNHDIGESQENPGRAGLPVLTSELRNRYLRYFGPDYWCRDAAGWRLIAVNAQLLGSNLSEATDQLRFVREATAGDADRSIALFIHKPLFQLHPEETGIRGRFIDPPARRDLLDALGDAKLTLIVSGHVHQFLSHRPQGKAHHVWAPSTAFVLPDSRQPLYGIKLTGYVEHHLHPDGTHDSLLITPPAVETLCIVDFPDAYAQYEIAGRR